MKYLNIILVFLFTISLATAQSDIQIVKIKQADKSVKVFAVNNGTMHYSVKVNITLEGMKLAAPVAPVIDLKPESQVAVAVLLPTAEKTKYSINFRATEVGDDQTQTMVMTVPEITIYTKNGQEKSTELRIYLEKYEIPYNEFNVTYDKKSRKIYENMLERRGIKKSKANLPVVIVKGEAYYQIKDVKKFMKEHFYPYTL